MKRQVIEEYLDGALDAAGRLEVEKTVLRDPAAARELELGKSERALRAAVYASYAPSKQEAASFAAQVMAACEDEAAVPVGSIGAWSWTRRVSSVAAAILIMAGIFVAGRMTAPATVVNQPVEVAKTNTRVIYKGAHDETSMREFTDGQNEELTAYMKSLDENGPSGFAATDNLSSSGLLDPGHM